MADLITVSQWTDRTGRTLSATELTQVGALIEDASALVVNIVNDTTLTDDWDASTPGTVPGAVVPVVVAMVRRGLDNPLGFTQENADGYSYSVASTTGVFASRREAREVRKAAAKSPAGALNLSSHLPRSRRDDHYSYLDGGL